MKRKYLMIFVLVLSVLIVVVLGGWIYYLKIKSPNGASQGTIINDQLVGNDTDEHGCKGSAGYQWCATKGKCLRIWEEECPTDPNIITKQVRSDLIAKRGESINQLVFTISKIQGNYAQGGISGQGGGGMWFAANIDGTWKLVWDGNGVILCSDLTNYPDFPTSMIPECFDSATQKTVVR
jgi:hypothetical protein